MIVNAHEHLESPEEFPAYLKIMEKTGVDRVIFVGSGNATIYQCTPHGFEGYHERNLALLKGLKRYDDIVSVFPTLNPLDPDNLDRMKRYLDLGARGIKLYYGLASNHFKGPWHTVPLHDARMAPVFELCRELDLPVIFHVNRVSFYEEMLRLLEAHPGLKICFPHFMVSSKSRHRLRRVAAILDHYPNVYTDCSNGRENHLLPFCESMTRRPREFRLFFRRYSTRIMWGTDLVITKVKMATMVPYVEAMIRWYRDIVEGWDYTTPEFAGGRKMKGMGLSGSELANVCSKTFLRFIQSKIYQPSFIETQPKHDVRNSNVPPG
jgi:predicted TIM-barrel fold metal-dependent hydrolase